MITLPQFVRRLPFIFYFLAALFFGWQTANQWVSMTSLAGYTDPSLTSALAVQKSIILYSAALEATYLIANGAIIHVLIAIHDRLGGAAE